MNRRFSSHLSLWVVRRWSLASGGPTRFVSHIEARPLVIALRYFVALGPFPSSKQGRIKICKPILAEKIK